MNRNRLEVSAILILAIGITAPAADFQIAARDPIVVGSVIDNTNLHGACSVYVSGRYAYLANDFDGLRIYDISCVDAPGGMVGSLAAGSLDVYDNLVVGQSAHITGGLSVGTSGVSVGSGVSLGSAVGVSVGNGVSLGSGAGVSVDEGASLGSGVGVSVGKGVSVGVGAGVSVS